MYREICAIDETVMNFEILEKDEILAHVIYDVSNQTVIECIQYSEVLMKRPFGDFVVTGEVIEDFLEDRCFEKGRADCDLLLKMLGLIYYSPVDIVRKTHGVMMEDFIWIRFKGENLTFKDINIRSKKINSNQT